MERVYYLGLKTRKSKEGKTYHLLFVVLDCQNSYDNVQILISEEQYKLLDDMEHSEELFLGTDFSRYLKLEYNSYLKRYELKCSL